MSKKTCNSHKSWGYNQELEYKMKDTSLWIVGQKGFKGPEENTGYCFALGFLPELDSKTVAEDNTYFSYRTQR